MTETLAKWIYLSLLYLVLFVYMVLSWLASWFPTRSAASTSRHLDDLTDGIRRALPKTAGDSLTERPPHWVPIDSPQSGWGHGAKSALFWEVSGGMPADTGSAAVQALLEHWRARAYRIRRARLTPAGRMDVRVSAPGDITARAATWSPRKGSGFSCSAHSRYVWRRGIPHLGGPPA
ncbi:hypothetical protein G5C51_15030 [Streptomyces sp. A7024]|uniref:Uncharacterized protein n=1 Tax=Streptomyces coryli TaxID=1128680 RepID=A0A6G4U1P9_9ACTN|nr:hypothetical protein [Streptomyces coryli]NGN65207.1 hypothetical protein [Streptomyces coryli]